MRLKKIKWQHIALLIILVVGAYLRLYKISEYMTFLGDEGRDVLVVKRMIVDHKFTLLGPTASVGGFFLGPIYYYFMLPFLWAWKLDPTGSAVMVALFGIATILLVYKVGSDFFHQNAGLFAATLYALSPLVIAYSRSSWNPNLVPFFSLLYIYSLWKGVKISSLRWYFLTGLSVGVGLQLHYLFTFLIPVGIVYIFLYDRGFKKWKEYFSAGAGLLIGWAPFLAFELRHGFPNTQTIVRFIVGGEETGFVPSQVKKILVDIVFRLFARLVFFFPPPEQLYLYNKTIVYWWRFAVLASLILSLGLLLAQVIKKRRQTYILMILWFLFGVGFFAFYQRAIYDYYLGIMFPLPFLLLGNLFAFAWSSQTRWNNYFLKPVVVIAFVALAGLNWYGRPFKHSPNRQLEQVKEISRLVFEKAEDKPYNFALITGGNSDHAYRYFLEIWGNPPVTIENFDNDPERKTVTDQLLIVCESLPCEPLGHSLWEIAGFGKAEIAGEWDVSVVKVYKLVHFKDGKRSSTPL